MNCPQCDQHLIQVGQFWICPTHGQLRESKSAASLRVFLSYGHDANEDLVRRIKADLEKRGHDVWFDKSDIKFGDDWRRAITDGIVGSNRILSFLSKHSTRDPGVCRDEIAIAIGVKAGNIQTILVESEQEVQPPVNIGHIQWLDMHDWKERRAAGEAAWQEWYQAKLAEIVRVVESDESRRFAGEIETLNGHLKPIKSEARICQLLSKGFYGRQWLFQAVEKWRTASKDGPSGTDSRLFWIMGAPGVGKSAFAAQLTHTRGDTVVAAQFCEWDKPDHRNAPRVVRSLAFQLATRLPDYRKLLLTLPEIAELDRKDAAELFDYLLANPLRSVIHGGRERYLIVIDALDEAGEAGRNPLVEMLARNAQRLPDWLGLVVTSRPEFNVRLSLQSEIPILLDHKNPHNRDDIRDCLRGRLVSQLQNRPDADCLVEQILEKSEGVFLYVEGFCEDIHKGYYSLDHPETFPQGLGEKFYMDFRRYFPDLETFKKNVRPALRAILAARGPLPVEILQRLFNWQDEELRDFTRPIASFFPVTTETGRKVIKPYHKSLVDWLADEAKAGEFFVSAMEGHRMLRDYCRSGWAQEDFSLAHFPAHLASCHNYEELASLLISADFVRAKRLRLGYEMLSNDYEWADHCLAVLTTASDRGLFTRVTEAAKSLVGFSGRKAETACVEQFLDGGRHLHLFVTGVGGVGKSSLLKHVWFTDIRRRILINLQSVRHATDQELVEHVMNCTFDHAVGRRPSAAERAVGIQSLSDLRPRIQCLMIDGVDEFDAAWSAAVRKLYRSDVKIVWSTRHSERVFREFGESVEVLELDSLSAGDALEVLRKTGLLGSDGLFQEDAAALVQELEGLPLALALSAAYMKGNGCTIREYLARYRQSCAQHPVETGSVTAGLQATFDKVLSVLPRSQQMRLAELCIAAEAGPLSEDKVREFWHESGNLSATATGALLSKLQHLSLIRVHGDGANRNIEVHKLIKEFLRRFTPAS